MSNKLSLDDLPAPRLEDLPSPDQEMSLDSLPSPTIDNLPAPTPEWSKTQSFGQGALQGATLGFSDELGGALGAGMEKLAGNPDNKSWSDLYNEYRTFQRGRNEEASESNPMTYLGGNVAGGVASVPLMSLPVTGAGIVGAGAATGLGTSSSDLTGPNPETGHAAFDTITGGVLGGVGHALGGSAGMNAAQREAKASIQAAKAAGVPMPKELGKGMGARPTVQRGIGKTALEEGTLPLTGGPRKMYEETLDAISRNEEELNKFYPEVAKELKGKHEEEIINGLNELQKQRAMSSGATPEQAQMASGELGQKVQNKILGISEQLADRPDGQALINKVYNGLLKGEQRLNPRTGEMEQIAPSYMEKLSSSQYDINQLNKYKKGLYAAIKDMSKTAYDNPSTEQSVMLGVYKQLANTVKSHIEDLSELTRAGRGTELKEVNKNLGNLYDLADSTFKLTAKDANTPLVGFKDLGMAGLGMASAGLTPTVIAGGVIKGVGLATGNSMGRIMNILSAKGNYMGAQALKNKPIQIVQKPLAQAITRIPISPAIQESVQEFNPNDTYKLNNYLYNSTDDSLKLVGERLKVKPGLEHYGEILVKSIERGDRDGKNKAIFVISQNPSARKALKEMEDER